MFNLCFDKEVLSFRTGIPRYEKAKAMILLRSEIDEMEK
jgi:hypothetical protein